MCTGGEIAVIMTVSQLFSQISGGMAASNSAERAAENNRKLAIERARLDQELADKSATQQRDIAARQLKMQQDNAIMQATMQNQQMLVGQEQTMRQMAEAEKLKIGEESRMAKMLYEKSLRTIDAESRNRYVRLRDTILTSPLGVLGDSQEGTKF